MELILPPHFGADACLRLRQADLLCKIPMGARCRSYSLRERREALTSDPQFLQVWRRFLRITPPESKHRLRPHDAAL